MQSDTYKELRKLINEKVPDLREISLGCELEVKDCDGKKHIVTFASDADYAGLIYKNGDTGSYVKEWVVKILGHPPQLQHVLQVIERDIHPVMQPSLDLKTGYLILWTANQGRIKWDLTKPLSKQSEETLQTLTTIIKD